MKDKRILRTLDVNSRASYVQIAKEVGLKQGTVRYRIQNLVEHGVIMKFQTVINSAKIGIAYHKVFLRLQATQKQRDELIAYLTEHPRTTWVGKVDGSYDVGINVLTTSLKDLSEFLSSLFEKYPEDILEKKISANLGGTYHARHHLIGEERTYPETKSYTVTGQEQPIDLDETDFNILKQLCQNSRTSTVQLGKHAGISHDAAMNRLKKLEEQKIITRYSIVVDNEAIQQLNYKVLVYLRKFSNKRIRAITRHLGSTNRITYVVESLGEWDLDFEAEVKNAAEIRKILNELTDAFPDHITRCEQLLIYDFTKYDYLPIKYTYDMYSEKT